MKYTILLFTLFSLNGYAQDGYHLEPQDICLPEEDCLVNLYFDSVIKFLPIENRKGEVVGERLSSYSSLSDMVYKKANLCYHGESQKICDMVQTLADFEEGEYFNGGHSLIKKFHCEASSDEVLRVNYTLKHDMASRLENVLVLIPECQNNNL